MEKSVSNTGTFQLADRKWLNSLFNTREGEEKLGESIQLCEELSKESLQVSSAKYVIIGAPEDIGPRANLGRGGSDSAWSPAMGKLLNMQSNEHLSGDELLLLGHFDFEDWMKEAKKLSTDNADDLQKLRELTSQIDEVIHPLVQIIVEAEKIPILIGGGHNNSYPLIRGVAEGLKNLHNKQDASLNCINLDPHADYREMEGRHSGNGFRYAAEEGYLKQYSIIALHESYNSQQMLDQLSASNCYYSTFEDIFLRKKWGFKQAIQTGVEKTDTTHFGLELDLDSIENIPTSAETPSGISTKQARFFVTHVAQFSNCSYFHIAEGAPSLKENSKDNVGKLIAYLICDFVKAHRKKKIKWV